MIDWVRATKGRNHKDSAVGVTFKVLANIHRLQVWLIILKWPRAAVYFGKAKQLTSKIYDLRVGA